MGQKFEQLSCELFKELGFEVFYSDVESKSTKYRYRFDIGISKTDKKFAVEVKSSTQSNYSNLQLLSDSIKRLVIEANENNLIPVLMVYSFISKSAKEEFRKQYSKEGFILLDLSNILYLASKGLLYDSIVAEIPYSVDRVRYEKVNIDSLDIENDDTSFNSSNYQRKIIRLSPVDLSNCEPGENGAIKFEDICSNALLNTLGEDLSLWKRQPRSNHDLYRFDLLCRIKDYNRKSFWNIVERHFNSKYVVFEFKNYKNRITQKEIYTTEKYLYSKALRNLAVIVARNGFDKNSIWAAKGALRENGKLIIILNIDDLNLMMDLKNKREDPSSVLLGKLDNLLIDLEK